MTNYYSYNEKTFYEDYYTADLHWNIKGALKATLQINDKFNAFDSSKYDVVQQSNVLFAGREARDALYDINSSVYEICNSFSNLQITKDDGKIINGNQHLKFDSANELQKYYDFYATYYCDIEDSKVTGGKGESNVLLVADSFGSALERPLADSCKTLWHSGLLRHEKTSNEYLSSWFKNKNIDTVIFVARMMDYESFSNRNPNFFKQSAK